MPGKNPKHQRKTVNTTYKRKRRRFYLPRRAILGIVFIAIFSVSIVAIILTFQTQEEWASTHVQVGDTVTVQYSLWKSNENAEKIDFVETGDFIVVLGEDEKNCTINGQPSGLIYGFYKGLLGMKNGSITNPPLWLPACVDDLKHPPDDLHPDAVAGDGWDDRYAPGKVKCQSYGSGPLRYTALLFQIQIVDLKKGS